MKQNQCQRRVSLLWLHVRVRPCFPSLLVFPPIIRLFFFNAQPKNAGPRKPKVRYLSVIIMLILNYSYNLPKCWRKKFVNILINDCIIENWCVPYTIYNLFQIETESCQICQICQYCFICENIDWVGYIHWSYVFWLFVHTICHSSQILYNV